MICSTKSVPDIDIPVYLADSVLAPSEGTELETHGKFSFRTAVGRFSLPRSLIKADYIDELANLLESCVESENSTQVFRERLCAVFPIDERKDARDIATVEALYTQLIELDRQHINGIWARIIKNAFAPLFQPEFDFIAGNPPWINWESLPDEYRQQTAPLWQHYGLFSHTGLRARLGSAKDDLSVLMLYVAADRYLKPKGKLGFVITQTIFKTEGGGAGFRRLQLGDGELLRVLQVDDFSNIQCFEGATNRTAVVIIRKGESTQFPLRAYNFWRKRQPRALLTTESDHDEAMAALTYSQWSARPIDRSNATSPWLTGRARAIEHIDHAVGESAYKGRAGTCGWLNSVYWLQISSNRPDGSVVINNLHNVGRIHVRSVQAPIESELIFPLLRGRDVDRWFARPEYSILVPQNPNKPSRGYPVAEMQSNLPRTFAYLKNFEEILRQRAGFRRFFNPDTDPFYSMYNVGTYTFAHFKVLWREVANDIRAGVAEPPKKSDKVIVPDHTLISVGCASHEEAHFVCALLNSSPANFIVRSYVALHPSPHILNHIRIPQFDPRKKLHVRLAESSEACHSATAAGSDLESLEITNDALAAELWELSNAELKDIEDSLADLS